MSTTQFIIFLVAIVSITIGAVEFATSRRWGEIKRMFDRAITHGTSFDTTVAKIDTDNKKLNARLETVEKQHSELLASVNTLHEDMKVLKDRLPSTWPPRT